MIKLQVRFKINMGLETYELYCNNTLVAQYWSKEKAVTAMQVYAKKLNQSAA